MGKAASFDVPLLGEKRKRKGKKAIFNNYQFKKFKKIATYNSTKQ